MNDVGKNHKPQEEQTVIVRVLLFIWEAPTVWVFSAPHTWVHPQPLGGHHTKHGYKVDHIAVMV